MLCSKANVIVQEIKEVKKLCMKSLKHYMDLSDIDFDDEGAMMGMKALSKSLKLLDLCEDYMVEQAEELDRIELKLDKLLTISERKGSN